jgi:hypothetical protein
MKINSITEYNNQMYQHMQIRNAERRHEQIVLEERRIKSLREVDELKLIEMNRRMNRPGQNVDRMA